MSNNDQQNGFDLLEGPEDASDQHSHGGESHGEAAVPLVEPPGPDEQVQAVPQDAPGLEDQGAVPQEVPGPFAGQGQGL